jgi:hypothetical protein
MAYFTRVTEKSLFLHSFANPAAYEFMSYKFGPNGPDKDDPGKGDLYLPYGSEWEDLICSRLNRLSVRNVYPLTMIQN